MILVQHQKCEGMHLYFKIEEHFGWDFNALLYWWKGSTCVNKILLVHVFGVDICMNLWYARLLMGVGSDLQRWAELGLANLWTIVCALTLNSRLMDVIVFDRVYLCQISRRNCETWNWYAPLKLISPCGGSPLKDCVSYVHAPGGGRLCTDG